MITRNPTKLQQKVLEIYKEIKKICDDNNLTIYTEGATTIGAVLYGGFVPWDDDIDIRLCRKDYEKFKEIAPNLLPSYLKVHDGSTDPNADYIFLKVHDVRTMFTRNQLMNYPESYTGVFVDVAPLDGGFSDIDSRDKYYKELGILNLKNLIRKTKDRIALEWFIDELERWDTDFNRDKLSSIFEKSPNYYSEKMHELARTADFDNDFYSATIERAGAQNLHHFDSIKYEYQSVLEYNFCDITITVPVGYKDILRKSLGLMPTLKTQKDYERKEFYIGGSHLVDSIVSLDKGIEEYRSEFSDKGYIFGDYKIEKGEIISENPRISIVVSNKYKNLDCTDLIKAIKFQYYEDFVCIIEDGVVFDRYVIENDGRFLIDNTVDVDISQDKTVINLHNNMLISDDFLDTIVGLIDDSRVNKISYSAGEERFFINKLGMTSGDLYHIDSDIARIKTDFNEIIDGLQKENDKLKDNVDRDRFVSRVKKRFIHYKR